MAYSVNQTSPRTRTVWEPESQRCREAQNSFIDSGRPSSNPVPSIRYRGSSAGPMTTISPTPRSRRSLTVLKNGLSTEIGHEVGGDAEVVLPLGLASPAANDVS